MIAELDTYIVNRLQKIRFEGSPIRVLMDYPEREAGKAIYPCVSVVRQEPSVYRGNSRYSLNVWIPSETESSVEFEGETFTGPDSYTVKPYPVAISIPYEIMIYTTQRNHADYLLEAIYKVIPPHSSATVAGQYPFFIYSGSSTFGDLDKPLYGMTFELEVRDIYVERYESTVIPSLKSITVDSDIVEDITQI